ncbi:MAG TPA: hypothetical protein VFN95_16675 [Flavitalea sp.]|nr:hypothetical protein [Flavitalea sp.]
MKESAGMNGLRTGESIGNSGVWSRNYRKGTRIAWSAEALVKVGFVLTKVAV